MVAPADIPEWARRPVDLDGLTVLSPVDSHGASSRTRL